MRIPSVAETVRTYALRGLFGERFQWRGLLTAMLFSVALVLAIPRLDSSDYSLLAFFGIFAAIDAWEVVRREYLFGGPGRLIVAAGITNFVGNIAYLVVLYAASVTFGPPPGSAPIDAFRRLPSNLVIGSFLAFGMLLAILYVIRKPAQKRQEAEFQALVDAERARRGKPPRRVDKEPTPKEAPGPVTLL